ENHLAKTSLPLHSYRLCPLPLPKPHTAAQGRLRLYESLLPKFFSHVISFLICRIRIFKTPKIPAK
ncbi:MAG: hypothetical protein LBC93_04715, partial [Synergistaceae bacterium]|nr:hypothetical protein [Synergistaceae bacterium]